MWSEGGRCSSPDIQISSEITYNHIFKGNHTFFHEKTPFSREQHRIWAFSDTLKNQLLGGGRHNTPFSPTVDGHIFFHFFRTTSSLKFTKFYILPGPRQSFFLSWNGTPEPPDKVKHFKICKFLCSENFEKFPKLSIFKKMWPWLPHFNFVWGTGFFFGCIGNFVRGSGESSSSPFLICS